MLVGELIHVHSVIFNLNGIELLHYVVAMVLFASIVDGDHLGAPPGELEGEKPVRSADVEDTQSAKVVCQPHLLWEKSGVVSAWCEETGYIAKA
jgi:hypothetical protein